MLRVFLRPLGTATLWPDGVFNTNASQFLRFTSINGVEICLIASSKLFVTIIPELKKNSIIINLYL